MNGSELAPFTYESVSVPITVDLALTLGTLPPNVSVSAFLKTITN